MNLSDAIIAYKLAYPKPKIREKSLPLSISLDDEASCFEALADLLLPNGIISGLTVAVDGSNNIIIQPGVWQIDRVRYSKETVTTFPLDAQDPTLSRYDVIYADTFGALHLLSGALSNSPIVPAIPDSTLLICTALITPTIVTIGTPFPTDYVDTLTNQNHIDGIKTFIKSPQVPLAVGANDAVPLSQVVSLVGTFNNGLTRTGTVTQLGGANPLIHNTDINTGAFVLSITGKMTVSSVPVNPTDVVRLQDLNLPDGILSGLGLAVSGSNVIVAPGTWRLSNIVYSKGTSTTLPVDAQDATLSRFDAIYADNTSNIHIVSGTLASNPSIPDIPAGTIRVGTVLITPTSVTTVISPIVDYVNTLYDQIVAGRKTFMEFLTMNAGATVNGDFKVFNLNNTSFQVNNSGIISMGYFMDFKDEDGHILLHLGNGSNADISWAPHLQITDAPTQPNDVVRLQDLPTVTGFMPTTGGAFTGPVTLSADPTVALGAATKQYVDNAISGLTVYFATGTFSGAGTIGSPYALGANIVGVGNLSATGTPSSSTYLRGDNTWATVAGGGGTVTSVSGIDTNGFTWSIANNSTTPAITLSLQNASASQSGQLTNTDWATFNSKQPAGSYLTGNQSITLTGDISGSGATSITTTIGAGKVVNSMIAAATIDLTTKVTGILPVANGGTGTATPGLVAGANVGVSGTWPNQIISASLGNTILNNISLLNITGTTSFGDSFTIGFGTTGTYAPFPAALGAMINAGLTNWGVSNTGVVNATNSGFSHIGTQNRTQLITWMSGLNDLRQNGATTACLNQITGNLTSFLVNALSHYQASGGGSGNVGGIGTFTKTGTWTTSAVTAYSGKAQYLSPTTAAASSTSGSSIAFNIDGFTDTIAIGSFSDDGTGPNALGAFSVYIDGTLYTTYTPTGRNTGIANPAPTTQGRMPEAIIIPGVAGRTVTITTNSNTLTLIDYVAALNYPQSCAPILVLSIPKMTATGYASAPANASDPVINTGNVTVQNVVALFKGFPVYYIDVNLYYTPNIGTFTQADGIHPNNAGHQQIAYGIFNYFQGNSNFYTGNDLLINTLTIGQGPNSVGVGGVNASGAVFGSGALKSNSSGSQMIAIGGLAGQSITGGNGCVMIGYFAFGNASGSKANVTAVGYEAGVSVNTNYGTFIGAISVPVDITLSNCVVISDGQGVARFEYKPDVGQTTFPASSAVVPAGAFGVGRLAAVSGTPTITPSNTGGAMNAGTYFYKIVAVDYLGNVTTASTQVSATVSGSGTNSIALSWTAVVGAVSYRIYRGTTTNGQNGYWTSTTNSYTDIAASGGTVGTVNGFNSSAVAYLNQDGTIYGNNLKINGAQTLVSGSTSGTANFSQSVQGPTWKKVVIYCNSLLGTASYTYPTPFINTPAIVTTNGPAAGVVTSLSNTAATLTGATTTGVIILEGY